MSDFNDKYNEIIKEIEENIKDEKQLEFIKSKINEVNAIFINIIDKMANNSDDRINILEQRLDKIQNLINSIKQDIYEQYDDDFEFEVICPYCNHIFTSDNLQEEENQDIECPECHNIIELDWNGDDCDEECSSCAGECSSCLDKIEHIKRENEDEDDDM